MLHSENGSLIVATLHDGMYEVWWPLSFDEEMLRYARHDGPESLMKYNDLGLSSCNFAQLHIILLIEASSSPSGFKTTLLTACLHSSQLHLEPNYQKNPRAHKKIKSALPPPPKPKIPPPPKTRNFMDTGFPAESTHFSRCP